MQQTGPMVTFEGTDEERQLAEQVFRVARFHGRLFAATAPIRLKRDDLIQVLAGRDGDPAALGPALDAALGRNPAVFARHETADGVIEYATTLAGRAPVEEQEDLAHTFKVRLMTPVAAAPPPPPRLAPRISDAWTRPPVFDGVTEEVEPGKLAADQDGLDALAEIAATEAEAATDTAVDAGEVERAIAALRDAAPVTDQPAAEPAVVAVPEPETAAPPPLSAVPPDALRAALAARLAADDRFAHFGDRYLSEDQVDRYSRGDLRRIREFILEETVPLADDTLLQSLFGRRPNDPSYEAARFSINYRLARERREFEFVGTRQSRLWSTTGLAPIGTTARKASELGTDFRSLLDEPAAAAPGATVTHILTFYEWVYGLLPLDGLLRQFFPDPYLDDQKSAVLRFEVPQLFVSFLAELRYPTANRGGYLVGFDEFYRESLAPGAVFTIERAPDNDGQYVIRYAATAQNEQRLLQIDERRNRYVFRPQSLYCQVNPDWTLREDRYPRLAGAKPLDERERRRPELVAGMAFERGAENVGAKAAPRYWSTPEDLLPVVNIERPFSLRALREVLESPQFPQFSADPDTEGAFFYEPPAKAQGASKKRAAARDADEADDIDDEE